MTWFKIDDGFSSHPKIMDVLDSEHPADAIAVWTMAGSYCARHLTNGFITAKQLRRLCADLNHDEGASVLVEAGLWHEVEGGYEFHEWFDHQPSRDEVESKRAKNRERVTRYRERRNALQEQNGNPTTSEDSRDLPDGDDVTHDGNESVTRYNGPSNTVTDDVTHDVTRYKDPCNATPDPTRPDPTRPVRSSSSTSKPQRRRDPLEYHRNHPVYLAALAAMREAREVAGWGPLTDAAPPIQSALGLACVAAEDLAESNGLDVGDVLRTAARGFVAPRKPGARLEWWAENFGDAWQAGTAPQSAPELSALEAEQLKLVEEHRLADPDRQAELTAQIKLIAAKRRKLKGAA